MRCSGRIMGKQADRKARAVIAEPDRRPGL